MTNSQMIAELEDALNQLESLKASLVHLLEKARAKQSLHPLANYLAAFDEHENLGVGAI